MMFNIFVQALYELYCIHIQERLQAFEGEFGSRLEIHELEIEVVSLSGMI